MPGKSQNSAVESCDFSFEVVVSVIESDNEKLSVNSICKLLYEKISNIISSYPNDNRNVLVNQYQMIYSVAKALHILNDEVLKKPEEVFYQEFYFPVILKIVKASCRKAYNVTLNIIKNSIKRVLNTNDIITKYIYLFVNEDILVSDIALIFFKMFIYERPPFRIKNIKDFYESLIDQMVIYYLNNRISGIFNYSFDIAFFGDGKQIMNSSRFKIYEAGYNLYYLNKVSDQSETVKIVIDNYKKIKHMIIDNEFHKFFLKYLSINSTNSKDILVSLYSDMINLEYIKNKTPNIYSILRSIKIASDESSFDRKYIEMMKQKIYPLFIKKFKSVSYDDIELHKICRMIVDSLCESFYNGKYVDPVTLKDIRIDYDKFIDEFIVFIETVFFNKQETAQWN